MESIDPHSIRANAPKGSPGTPNKTNLTKTTKLLAWKRNIPCRIIEQKEKGLSYEVQTGFRMLPCGAIEGPTTGCFPGFKIYRYRPSKLLPWFSISIKGIKDKNIHKDKFYFSTSRHGMALCASIFCAWHRGTIRFTRGVSPPCRRPKEQDLNIWNNTGFGSIRKLGYRPKL